MLEQNLDRAKEVTCLSEGRPFWSRAQSQDLHRVKEVTCLSEGKPFWSRTQTYHKTQEQGRHGVCCAGTVSERQSEKRGPTDAQEQLDKTGYRRPLQRYCQDEKR